MVKPQISYPDFAKLDLRVGTIMAAEEVQGSEKLVKFLVDLGDPPAGAESDSAGGGKRMILAGVKKLLDWQNLIGTQVLVLANLEPKKFFGLGSQGMILMAVEKVGEREGGKGIERSGEKVTLLIPQNKVPEGTGIE